jgi:hypothetical protein
VYYPGSSGWIEKYCDLIEKKEIALFDRLTESEDLISLSRNTGLLFGIPLSQLFYPDPKTQNWTYHDRLKSLFFETLLWVHLKHNGNKFYKDQFIEDLANYYSTVKPKNSFDFLSFFKKESVIHSIELAIDERLELNKRLIETRVWLSTLTNSFVFLDVILFQEFLQTTAVRPFQVLTEKSMNCFIGAAHSDQELTESEEKLFAYFLASARLNENEDDQLESLFKNPNFLPDLQLAVNESIEFKYYILYFCAFIISCNREIHDEEREFLIQLAKELAISEDEVDLALTFNTAFILDHTREIPYLGSSSADILFSNLSKRWGKILLRNKDKLVLEIQQSKELMILLGKSTQRDLTKEEKEQVKMQLMDIMKSMPSLAIFLIPGGSLLLPIFLKIIPSLMPSAFRDNEV